MKMREWERTLSQLHNRSGKQFYRVAELANLAINHSKLRGIELARLVNAGLLIRYTHGIYGIPEATDVPQLAAVMDSHSYVTGEAALYHHGLMTQASTRKTCFTNRRHNRSRVRHTPLGIFTFCSVSSPVYTPPDKHEYAPPAQALHDFVFIMRQRGAEPESVATLRNLDMIEKAEMDTVAMRYPDTVRRQARALWLAHAGSTHHTR